MRRKVRISDVAQKAGVSVTTVSQILNNKGARFSQKTIDKVLEIRDEMGYVPDYNARSLIMGSTKTIGVIVPDLSNPFFTSFLKGIGQAAEEEQFIPLILGSEDNQALERTYIEQLVQRSVDGMIIASPLVERDIIDHLLKSNGIPYILIDQNPVAEGDRLYTDDADGARQAVQHLLDLGHQKIALIYSDKPTINVTYRLRGYEEALEKAGIGFDPKLVLTTPMTKEGGYQVAQSLIDSEATAAVTINDEVAIGLYHGLQEKGKSIPEDYSIVGYDDIDLAAYLNPTLTTVAQPVMHLGNLALRRLVARIKDHNLADEKVKLPVKLVVRHSTRRLGQ